MRPLRTGWFEGVFCVLGWFGENTRSLDFASGSLRESDAALGMTVFCGMTDLLVGMTVFRGMTVSYTGRQFVRLKGVNLDELRCGGWGFVGLGCWAR